jgi:UDP-N-acetylmuramate dehydrogenase
LSSSKKSIPSPTTLKIHRNVNLKPYNSLGVEAFADQFVVISNTGDLNELFQQNLLNDEIIVLGSGSNILFNGRVKQLVLKNEIQFLDVVDETEKQIVIRSGGGNDWHELVTECVENGWGGIENLALIPGTVGAAPIQNIGAYGVELEDRFVSLEAFNLKSGNVEVFDKEDCRFGYRDSIFKNELKGERVVLSVTLALSKPPHQIRGEYQSLKKWLIENDIQNPGIKDIYRGVVEIRTEKLPNPFDLGNAGSFFKNPVISRSKYDELKKNFDSVPSYPAVDDRVKVPAAWLIEKTGWKGRRVGNTGTYKNQALVIVNHGGATGEEIWQLAIRIQESVLKTFGIELVPEVNVIGSPDV